MLYRVTTADGRTIDRAHKQDADRAAQLYGGTVQIVNLRRELMKTHGRNLLTGRAF